MTHTLLASRAAKMLARIEFSMTETLVFLRPDGAVDSCPAHSPRAVALMGADRGAGFTVVGIYRRGVGIEQLLADIREAQL